jgi:hypothetical protein
MLYKRLLKLFRREVPAAPMTDWQRMREALKPEKTQPLPKQVIPPTNLRKQSRP